MSFFTELMIVHEAKKIAREMRDEEVYEHYLEDRDNFVSGRTAGDGEVLNDVDSPDEDIHESFFERHDILWLVLKVLFLLLIAGGILAIVFWTVIESIL